MARQALALEGETVGEVCWRVLGYTRSVVEQVLEGNPGLAGTGPACPLAPGHPARRDRVRRRADPRNRQPVGLNRCARSTACAKP
jgi:phage tail protein X